MSGKPSLFERIYYASYIIILMCIALLTISIASIAIDTQQEVKKIRIILQTDYEYVSEITQ